jgi:alpha-D-xyloside xylohydrolase
VSYVLSGSRKISEDTRQAVQRAIDELGYHPRASARTAEPDRGPGKTVRDGSVIELTAGELALRVDTATPWRLEFPDDPACHQLDRQYMLGDDLLVAPVFSEDGTVDYYVPEGTWTHLLTGERVAGPGWRRETHGFDTLPLLARPGSVVPFGAVDEGPEYNWVDGVTLRVHAPADGGETVTAVPAPDGGIAALFRTSRTGDVVTVEAENATSWRVLLVGADVVDGVEGAAAERTPLGVLIEAGSSVVTARWS